MNLAREEQLSVAVRKFKCLYDKSSKDYKNKFVKQIAWQEVARLAELESGEQAHSQWVNLKARYCRKRKLARRLAQSTEEEQKGKGDLEVYFMLQWLDAYVLSRNRQGNNANNTSLNSNCQLKAQERNEDVDAQGYDSINNDASITAQPRSENGSHFLSEEDIVEISKAIAGQRKESNETINGQRKESNETIYGQRRESNETINGQRKESNETINGQRKESNESRERKESYNKRRRMSKVTGGEKWERQFADRDREVSFSKKGVTLPDCAACERRTATEKNEDDVFGQLIASQMKKLPDVLKIQAKHQISILMYDLQMRMYHQQRPVSFPTISQQHKNQQHKDQQQHPDHQNADEQHTDTK